MAYSRRCRDMKTRWDRILSQCVLCRVKAGYEVTPNCGFDDQGGRHESPFNECRENSFNEGSGAYCQPCRSCPSGHITVRICNTTADTECEDSSRNWTSTAAVATDPTTPQPVSAASSNGPAVLTQQPTSPPPTAVMWAAPLAILISIMLVILSACVLCLKRKRGQHNNTVLNYNRRSSFINAGFTPLSTPPGYSDLQDILSPNILSAPLQTVLDNLDVLEDLVILLDPESQGVKSTKHLASHWSFPSTWITYTYSMKDSKSPLKAVLEGVTSRQPDWTIAHLVKLLRYMGRNDAIAVLAKLRLNVKDV